ncbi:hypothetical protein [Fictibacillus enclensis]|uniref:hypothetical protein n=1 Tax=Fictibacillus enclensis TaxID=1017270 RepID=UPI0024C0B808|nr:hypothetical protein [Fictibacillus enclensis]WHY73442.1 hypothetical protein QNH15_05890 [Fictibacillus enclensis]
MKKAVLLIDLGNEYDANEGLLMDDGKHGVFHESNKLCMVRVSKTEDPDVYRQNGGSMIIGDFEGTDFAPAVAGFVARMKRKSAFDFFTETIIPASEDIQFNLIACK